MTLAPESEQKLRTRFKYFNIFMLLLWRLGLGPWLNLLPRFGGRIMVLRHTGRKSGKKRLTPVNYAVVGGQIYCTAGFGNNADWYQNILLDPAIEIWLPDSWWAGSAEDISRSEARLPILRKVLISSGFAAKAFAGIDPYTISDEALDKLTKEYRVVRIHREEARTGRGGPGDLSWVWPLATFILLPIALFGRKRR